MANDKYRKEYTKDTWEMMQAWESGDDGYYADLKNEYLNFTDLDRRGIIKDNAIEGGENTIESASLSFSLASNKNASQITIVDVGGNYTGTSIESALTEIANGTTLDGRYALESNNLSDLTSVGTARTNLGLVAGGAGDVWVEKAGDTMTGELVMSGANIDLGTNQLVGEGGSAGLYVDADGNIGVNETNPTAWVHIGAGTATNPQLKLDAGVKLTTPEAGAFEFDGSSLAFTPATDRRSVNLSNGVALADVTVANTTVETTIFTESVSADELYKGSKWHTMVSGYYSTANASDTFTARLKVGSTTVHDFTSTAENVSNGFWRLEFFFTIRSTGVSGTIQSSVDGIFNTTNENEALTSTTTIDTTVAENITVTIQWDSANPGNTLTMTQGHTNVFGVKQA